MDGVKGNDRGKKDYSFLMGLAIVVLPQLAFAVLPIFF